MGEIHVDFTTGEFKLKDRRALEELGITLGENENPYVNIIENVHESIKLYCPNDGRRLFWNGARMHYECLDCEYVPPDPRIEAIKQEMAKDEFASRVYGGEPSQNHKRIRTRRGTIATGEKYSAIPPGMRDADDTGSPMEMRPVLGQRTGLRTSPQDAPAAYVSQVGERPLDDDERLMLEKGYTIKSRSEVSGQKNVVDTSETLHALRRRLGRELARNRMNYQ